MVRIAGLFMGALLLSAADGQERKNWIAVADRLARTAPESYVFDWGEGTQMHGLMQVYAKTKTPEYAAFVERWAAAHLPAGVERLLGNHAESKRKGFCGPWICGMALLDLYDDRKQPEHLAAASEIAAFIAKDAGRSDEGLLAHWLGNTQLWVDTLYMACPLLTKLSQIERRPPYLDDAALQLELAAKHGQNAETLLFHHMWDWSDGVRSEAQWGRGNGWVLMSLADTLEVLPESHPKSEELRSVANKLADGILKTQNKDGVWHTILTAPESPAESSCSSMFVYGLLKLVRIGVLPAKLREPAMKAWTEINRRWVKDGVVTGVSAGTVPAPAIKYHGLAMGTYTWGTGAYLLAGSEVYR